MATPTHVDRHWSEAFVLALRERNVSGTDIGDALAQVDSFCADSGEGARDAFGEPREYAASLTFAPRPAAPLLTGWQLAAALLGVATFLVLPEAVVAWAHDERVEVGFTDLTIVVVMAGLFLVLVRGLDAFLRLPVRRAVAIGAVVPVAAAALALAVARLLGDAAVSLPAAPAAVASAAVLVGPALVGQLRRRSTSAENLADVVVGPFEDPELVRRRGRRWTAVSVWVLPACAVVATALTWGLDAATRI